MISMNCIRATSFILFWGQILCFPLNNGSISKEIFPTCTILAAMRDDKDVGDMQKQIAYLKKKYEAEIELLRAPLLEISSTTIRERAAKGLTVHYFVPDAVADYIKEHHLYKEVEP